MSKADYTRRDFSEGRGGGSRSGNQPDVQLNRRSFLKTMGVGVTSLTLLCSLPSCRLNNGEKTDMHKSNSKKKVHIITLSFDDGFKKSSIRTAEIYEKYNLSACINVIATGHLRTFKAPGEYIKKSARGDFGLWNELSERGHEIMPHGYKHANKTQLPFRESKDLILRCLEYFSNELKGFEPKEAIFNFPYNASTPELESWLPAQVRAFRTSGSAINALPHKEQAKLTCRGYGPGSCEQDLEQRIEELLCKDSGWLIYNTHGLDDEGWGPIRSSFLDKLLERLLAIDTVEIAPAGKVLSEWSFR